MNTRSDSFADEILAVENAAATLLAARERSSIELAKAAALQGAHCPQIIIESAELLQKLGEPATALELLGGGLCLDGPTAPLQLAYARHCREAGQLDLARMWLRGAMLRARPNAAMALALCEIELGRGDTLAADDALSLSVQLRWLDSPGLRYAADRLIAISRLDLAVVPLMMMHLRAKGDLALRNELAALLRDHAPFEHIPEVVRSRLKLDDPAIYNEIAPAVMAQDSHHQYTNNWFSGSAKIVWDELIPQINPTRILEVGSYEGASTCYLIDTLSHQKDLEIHCIDTWQGGIEHKEGGYAQTNMPDVEKRFLSNTAGSIARSPNKVDLVIHKGFSDNELSRLIAEGKQGYFDFVYIDGSHQAPDVLCDAVLGFRLLRENGVIAFDDYLWQESLPYGADPIRSPKIAIDAFTNIYCRKISIIHAHLYQLYVKKLSN